MTSPSSTSGSAKGPTGTVRRSPGSSPDRRSLIVAASVLFIAIVGGVIVLSTSVNSGPRKDTQGQLQEQGGAKPHIIPLPNSGVAPQHPGDRGGWQQLALMGLMTVGVGIIGVLALRGNRTARANRAAWRAAGQVPEVRPDHPDAAPPTARGGTDPPMPATPPGQPDVDHATP